MEFKMSKDKWLLELKKMKKKYGCKRGKLIFLPIIKNFNAFFIAPFLNTYLFAKFSL